MLVVDAGPLVAACGLLLFQRIGVHVLLERLIDKILEIGGQRRAADRGRWPESASGGRPRRCAIRNEIQNSEIFAP